MSTMLTEWQQRYHGAQRGGLPIHYLDFEPGFELLVERIVLDSGVLKPDEDSGEYFLTPYLTDDSDSL